MPPAPIGVADRTGKKYYWRTVPGQHCLLAEGDIGAPIYWRTEASLRQYIGAPMSLCANSISISIICQAFSPVVRIGTPQPLNLQVSVSPL